MGEREIKAVVVDFNLIHWVNYDAIYEMKYSVEGAGLGAEIRSAVSHVWSMGFPSKFLRRNIKVVAGGMSLKFVGEFDIIVLALAYKKSLKPREWTGSSREDIWGRVWVLEPSPGAEQEEVGAQTQEPRSRKEDWEEGAGIVGRGPRKSGDTKGKRSVSRRLLTQRSAGSKAAESFRS